MKAVFKKYLVKLVFSGHRHISTNYQKVDNFFCFSTPPLSTYPMRYTVYEITPQEMPWEVKDVTASTEVRALAKNFLENKWWRGPDHPLTPEGDFEISGAL